MNTKYWLIQGYDGLTLIFEKYVDGFHLTDAQVQALLRALVAKAGLTFEEIIGGYARRRTTTANELLHVQRDGERSRFWCGTNPHFIAELRVRGHTLPSVRG